MAVAQVFSCKFCEISKNTFFTEHLRTTAFDYYDRYSSSHRRFSVKDEKLSIIECGKSVRRLWQRTLGDESKAIIFFARDDECHRCGWNQNLVSLFMHICSFKFAYVKKMKNKILHKIFLCSILCQEIIYSILKIRMV